MAASGVLLATIDASIVNIALPTISEFFSTSVQTTAWVTISYMLVVTAFLLVFGRLSDIYGQKLIFILGMAVFTGSSALCAFSGRIAYLIAFRAIQGLGAAMIMSNTPAIVTNVFPPEQRGTGLGVIGGVVSVGLMMGPPLGGIIIHYLGWPYIFLVNLPVGIAGIILSMKILPGRLFAGNTGQLKLVDPALWIIGITSFILVFGLAGRSGFSLGKAAPYSLVSLVLFGFFFARQFKSSAPLFDPVLLKNKIFVLSSAAGFFTYMSMIGVSFMMPFFLEWSLGLSPLNTGRLLMIIPATTMIASPLSGFLSDRYGQRPIAALGSIMVAVSMFYMLGFSAESSIVRIALNLVGMGVGIGMFGSPNNSALMGSVDNKNRGSAAGILATVRNLGMVSGLGLVSLYFNSGLNNPNPAKAILYAAAFHETMPMVIAFSLAAVLFSLFRRSV